MKKLLVLLLLACIGTAQAQTNSLPYQTGFDASAPAGWQLFKKGASTDPNVKWATTSFGAYAGAMCLYHGYPVGGTLLTDDWYVSPGFNFSNGGQIDSIRRSFSGFGTPQTGDTVAIYLLKGSADPALAASKTLLLDFRGSGYSNDNSWYKVPQVTIPSSSGTSYIAIRYRTTNNWLDVRFDNLSLSGKSAASVKNIRTEPEFTITPNPASSVITINARQRYSAVRIYDATGKMVVESAAATSLNVSGLSAGTYVVQVVTESGTSATSRFVKR